MAASPDHLSALQWLMDELGDPAKPGIPSVEAMAEASKWIRSLA